MFFEPQRTQRYTEKLIFSVKMLFPAWRNRKYSDIGNQFGKNMFAQPRLTL